MNKKPLIVIVIGIFTLALVNAGLLIYYGQITAEIEVTQPITITGSLEVPIENVVAGAYLERERDVWIANTADFPIDIVISDNSPEGINVIYEYTVCTGGACPAHQFLEGNTITVPAKYSSNETFPWNGQVGLYISYELDNMLETGTYIVTTTIDEVE